MIEREQVIAELEIKIAELRARVAELEARMGVVQSSIPKWEDMTHRHQEGEFL